MNTVSNPSDAPDFLQRMAASSRNRLTAALAERDEGSVARAAEQRAKPPALDLSADGFDLIAEVKRRSPSAGTLADASLSPRAQALRYASAGVAAISVLTEPEQFSGALEHLDEVAAEVSTVPAMRKDFLVAPYQILEARAAGAGGVLLIAAILDRSELRDMLQLTLELDMFALVEAFDAQDLERCLPVMDDIRSATSGEQRLPEILIGINCRNLRTLEIDFPRFETAASLLPPTFPWVAESGVVAAENAAEVARLGYRLALVGTALMRATDPAVAAGELLAAGRSA
jgi:indole-3-glycerol phosphate synthase